MQISEAERRALCGPGEGTVTLPDGTVIQCQGIPASQTDVDVTPQPADAWTNVLIWGVVAVVALMILKR